MKTVLVSGASSGIGEAIARKLLDEGHAVYAAARRVERMRGLEERGATALQMDVTNDAEVAAAVDRIARERGGVDVLVNNAGIMRLGTIAETDDALFDAQVAINLKGSFNAMREAAKRLREGGRIINLSSSVVGLYQPGVAGEQTPGLSVRFMGISRNAIASYLISLYCSLAVQTEDALAVLEDVEIGKFHDYPDTYK